MSSAPSELRHEIVRAGAGAGKTTALVRTVMDRVKSQRELGRWPRLLVTTFTRKATQELRERLTAEACASGDLELLDYCRSRSRLHISTIHGMLALFLRRYGHLLGIDPSYSILTDQGAEQLRRTVLRQVLQSHPNSAGLLESQPLKRLELLLKQYQEMICTEDKVRMINAAELSALIATEAQEFGKTTRDLSQSLMKSTDHPKAIEYAQYLEGVAKLLLGKWTDEAWTDLQAKLEDWPTKPAMRKGASVMGGLDEEVTASKKKLTAWLEDAANSPAMVNAFVEMAKQFEPVAKDFTDQLHKTKKSQGVLEMGDLEEMTLLALRESPAIGAAFAADWDFWLVDEFQDTSPLQVELINQLSGSRPRFIVGDPQQSIYLFRGARMEVFEEEERSIIEKGGQQRLLAKNYRSQASLLMFLNDFLKPCGFEPLQPRDENFIPESIVARFFPAPEGEKPFRREAEYKGLLAHILSLHKQNGVALSDICILARKNRSLFEIAQFLKANGIPTHIHASRGFYERREIKDALALLKFLVIPADNQNLIGLLRSPWCRVSDDQLVQSLRRNAPDFWRQILGSPLAELPEIKTLQEALKVAGESGYPIAWQNALVQLGFFDLSGLHDVTGRREANLWKLVSSLSTALRRPGFKILEFVDQGSTQKADTEASDEGDAVTAVEPNVVNLMTIHAAKGLERKHILLPHCDESSRSSRPEGLAARDGVWSMSAPGPDGVNMNSPLARHQSRIQQVRELAEQSRLLYVAVTRAQESIFISWTGKPDADSWAGTWHWPISESGIVRRDHYSYEVLGKLQGDSELTQSSQQAVKARKPWSTKADSTVTPTMAVVNLIQTDSPSVKKTNNTVSVADRIGKAVRGTAFHRLLEQVRLNPHQDFAELTRHWFPGDNLVLKALQYVRALESPPMEELLRSGYAEWGFQLKTNTHIVEGQIDLWGKSQGQIWVLDYKSGSSAGAALAFEQLNLYAYALRCFDHKEAIKLAVIYPFETKVEIQNFIGEETLTKKYPSLLRPAKFKLGGA